MKKYTFDDLQYWGSNELIELILKLQEAKNET
jgi:hypothetical protein